MVEMVREVLSDPKGLAREIEGINKNRKGFEIGISKLPYVKWNCSDFSDDREAVVSMLCQWIEIQKEHFPIGNKNHNDSISLTYLTELMGSYQSADNMVEKIRDKQIFTRISSVLIRNYEDEKKRKLELEGMEHTAGVLIRIKNGDELYFGRTSTFYFLVSEKYLRQVIVTISKNIQEILFGRERFIWVRKRPGMYIGSVSQVGFYRMIFGLIEELLEVAIRKEIIIKLWPNHIVEIICESFSAENNFFGISQLTIVSALSDFFEYQDHEQNIRTEKGQPVAAIERDLVDRGTRVIFKPDVSIFGNIDLDYFIILKQMMKLASMNPYRIHLSDDNNHNTIYIPSGIGVLLIPDYLESTSDRIIPINIVGDEFKGTAAISFSSYDNHIQKSYVNSHITQEGGVHAEGIMKGTRKALERILELYDRAPTLANIMRHLNYVIHIQIAKPRYQGAMKQTFKNIEVSLPVQQQVEQQVFDYLKEDISPLKSIFYAAFADNKKIIKPNENKGGQANE